MAHSSSLRNRAALIRSGNTLWQLPAVDGRSVMDPITTAIVAVLPALASDLLKSSAKDAYEGLKAVIRRTWGTASPIAKSVDALEASPKSKGQATVLAENVAQVDAMANAEVMQALGRLVDELKKAGIGGQALRGSRSTSQAAPCRESSARRTSRSAP
jgi:hypothetical protein